MIIDTFRKFIVKYPNWDKFNIRPFRGDVSSGVEDFEQVSIDWFHSASNVSQMALQLTGSEIQRSGFQPMWIEDINGYRTITRQLNFSILLVHFASTNEERKDTSEFLMDYVTWVDQQSVFGLNPKIGDDPIIERTWASSTTPLAEWDGKSKRASVYMMFMHHVFSNKYPPIFN